MNISFVTVAVDIRSKKKDYLKHAYTLLESIYKNTNSVASVLTNNPNYFEDLPKDRIKIFDTKDYNLTLKDRGYNQFLKAHALKLAKQQTDDYIIFLDGDTKINDWDQELIEELLSESNYDIFGKRIYCGLAKYKSNPKIHFKKYHDEILKLKNGGYSVQETHVIFKNNHSKLDKFLNLVLEFEKNNIEKGSRLDFIGIYFGICSSLCGFSVQGPLTKQWIKYYKQYQLDHLGKITSIVGRI